MASLWLPLFILVPTLIKFIANLLKCLVSLKEYLVNSNSPTFLNLFIVHLLDQLLNMARLYGILRQFYSIILCFYQVHESHKVGRWISYQEYLISNLAKPVKVES